MPKKIVVTEDQFIELEQKLTKMITDNCDKADKDVKATEAAWKAEVDKVRQTVTSNASVAATAVQDARTEAKSFTEECVKVLNDSILEISPPLLQKIDDVHEDAKMKLDELDTKLQQFVVDELTELANQFDSEIKTMRSELSNDIQQMGAEAAKELVDQREQIDEMIEKLSIACAEDRSRIREETKKMMDELVAKQKIRDEQQDEAREALQRDMYFEVGKLDELIREKEKKASSHSNEVAETAATNLSELDERQTAHLRDLDKATEHLRTRMLGAENVQTRRVEWVIKNASKTITPGPGGWSEEKLHSSWFSPTFDAAGIAGMRLELQMYKPPDPNNSTVEDRKAGNLGAFLWSCKGTKLCFKLYIGDRCTQFDKKFNGRAPCGTHRFCFLKDQIDAEDDTLRVGVEFLEVLRELDEPIQASRTTLRSSSKQKDGIAKAPTGTAEEAGPVVVVPTGSMCVLRHMSNRVIELVHKEVAVMESKMVRKIDWLLQNASKLRTYFVKDEAVCSPVFKAAGLDNMQLMLYPSGYSAACTPGFCSVFLYGPAGANIHCFLTLGNQTREIYHTFEVAGAYGRTNFCLLDPVINLQDDTVLLTLEIEEAVQEQSAPWLHEEVNPREPDSHKAAYSDKELQSVIKLTKNPGKSPLGKPNGRKGQMDTHMSLPSYWTAKPLGDNHSPQDGFHSFDEVTSRKPLPFGIETSTLSASWRKGTPRGEQERIMKSETSPSLGLGRAAMHEDLSPPLPTVKSGPIKASPDWEHDLNWRGASGMGQTQKSVSRRQRPQSTGSPQVGEL